MLYKQKRQTTKESVGRKRKRGREVCHKKRERSFDEEQSTQMMAWAQRRPISRTGELASAYPKQQSLRSHHAHLRTWLPRGAGEIRSQRNFKEAVCIDKATPGDFAIMLLFQDKDIRLLVCNHMLMRCRGSRVRSSSPRNSRSSRHCSVLLAETLAALATRRLSEACLALFNHHGLFPSIRKRSYTSSSRANECSSLSI